ncbi:MAG TPA: hypothetical protein PK625_11920, partial [Spirochaetales bacterium]|nr:hypothetical protein [Spirochaetales bacterium]
MTESPPRPLFFFLAKLSLPVHRLMVTAAVDCASHVGRMLTLNEKARSDLKMAVRAAFLNAVDHFTEPVQEDERIHL